MEAMVTNKPYKIGGNVLNTGLIDNLPSDACVEVPCLVDGSGVRPTHVGRLPVQLAAMNMTNINCQLLTIEAAVTGKKEHIYHAAMLEPPHGCRAFDRRHYQDVRRALRSARKGRISDPLSRKFITSEKSHGITHGSFLQY